MNKITLKTHLTTILISLKPYMVSVKRLSGIVFSCKMIKFTSGPVAYSEIDLMYLQQKFYFDKSGTKCLVYKIKNNPS